VNEKVTFPFIFNMNDYMQGYEGISNKRYEEEVKAHLEKVERTKAQLDEKRAKEGKEAYERNMMMGEDKPRPQKADADMKDEKQESSKKPQEKGVTISVGQA